MALAVRVHGCPGGVAAPDPRAVLQMVTRVMSEGDARARAIGADLGPRDACDLLRTWLRAIDLPADDGELLAILQAESSRAYASADVFLFASRTDTFGQVSSRRRRAGCRSSRSTTAARGSSSRTA